MSISHLLRTYDMQESLIYTLIITTVLSEIASNCGLQVPKCLCLYLQRSCNSVYREWTSIAGHQFYIKSYQDPVDDRIISTFCHSHQNLQESDVIIGKECLSLTSRKVSFTLRAFDIWGAYKFPLDSPYVFLFEKDY